jgi:L-fuculose-phosphate aldolase
MEVNEYQLRLEIVRVARIAANQGLISSSDGNMSIRLPNDRFLVTPSGLYKMSMEPDDPIVVNSTGEILTGKPGLRPTSELSMHLEVYAQRQDVDAVLHAHPPFATALTIAGIPFPTDYLPEVLLALGDVPTATYATPGTPALAESIQPYIKDHNSIMLANHGSISAGKTLEETLIALERLESAAYTYHLAQSVGQAQPLRQLELEKLRAIGMAARDYSQESSS